jgi:glycerol-3-phosphate dehydrogenase subunit C
MLKTGFAGILEDDKKFACAAKKIANNTFDLAEFLMAQADAGKLNTNFQHTALRLAYHAPCHQKSQGIGRPWYHRAGKLLVIFEDAGCCGMSGTYGFKQGKYPVSMEIGKELFASIDAAQPRMVATECATCQMQIEHGTNFKAIHPAEILLRVYDRAAPTEGRKDCSIEECECGPCRRKPEGTDH